MEYLPETYADRVRAQRIAEGVVIGIAIGRLEATLKIATNMLEDFTDEQIVMASKLSFNVVKIIRQEASKGREAIERLIGISVGKEEAILEIAFNMLDDYTDEQIAKVTELSLGFLAKIREVHYFYIT